MKRHLSIFLLILAASVPAFAHEAFTLVSSEKKTFKESEIASLEKQTSAVKRDVGTRETIADWLVKGRPGHPLG